jgi:hypothetical protein
MVISLAKCHICIRDRGRWRKYCDRCRRLVYRAGNKMGHVLALQRDYDEEKDVFRCHYTKVALVEDDPKSPRYLAFDHLVPGMKGKDNIVTTMMLYNASKTDMDYDEHVAFCREVVRASEGKGFDERVLVLGHWMRMAAMRARRGRRAV